MQFVAIDEDGVAGGQHRRRFSNLVFMAGAVQFDHGMVDGMRMRACGTHLVEQAGPADMAMGNG
ncbi:hypothetical protein GCM10009097_21320 [Pigmentiphaga daeguensis]|uniref:Uncharacterized protein n=1 Tax=Pigmentiphaga daeguensis TaxID=414049 RepID=A0ABN1BSF2_9BURK